MTPRDEDEPVFYDLNYVTITRDPRTQLVLAIGGDPRAAGILQTVGGFHSAPGAAREYHRLPHHLPVEEQRHGATAAAHALLLAGYSVHLDPTLNTLATPDGDRQAARRYLDGLESRARAAETDRDVAVLLAEITAPEEGVLPQLVRSLISTWATWGERRREAGLDEEPADQLMETTSSLSNHARRITLIRDQAARRTPAHRAPSGPAAAPPSASPAPSARRR
ncbi:hypothetical protein [Streptomyces himalayensis]|uniref:Uncharacterized protein n=1 Tax=Streptomyces himalayensis subsp. himalayensis TaxID=2756131 RepID=A0A7W0IC46_9ACTN|nr:hypothetical protein [Streptomyces himalayensis]MBA2950255.1 hypothetical protein [Streptomyces himalayensis subsp. himalayensis]